MPFSSTGSNFFRGAAQAQPLTNSGNPFATFSNATKIAGSQGNLFDTIQAVRANELERQTKQTAIAKALADLYTNQQELQLKQQEAPAANALRDAQAKYYGAQADILTRPITSSSGLPKQPTAIDSITTPEGVEIPKFIQKPGAPKFDSKTRTYIDTPGTFVTNPEYSKYLEAQQISAKKGQQMEGARKEFQRNFDVFKQLNGEIQRGDGMGRITTGLGTAISSVTQTGPRGQAAAAYAGARKRLAVSIARLTDVGNLSETEQKAAEWLVPNIYDSESTSKIKLAYIEALGGTSTEEDVRNILNGASQVASQEAGQSAVPSVGSTYNGQKVTAVRKVK